MPQTSPSFAVLFSDIVGSSALFQQLGNNLAQKRVNDILQEMAVHVHRSDGTVVKTIGDEIMAYFENPEQASQAAIAINLAGLHQDFLTRTGIAYGPVIFDAKDIYGDTVNTAAALTRAAHASEILLEEASVEDLPRWLSQQVELFDRVTLKGQQQKSNVYRVNWRSDSSPSLDITRVDKIQLKSNDIFSSQLQLRTSEKTLILDASDGPFTIGRDPLSVTLAIEDSRVSRSHCSISYHRGKFIFADHSTNGSYLQETGHEIVYLRRESAPLIRTGHINLGFRQSNLYNSIFYRLLQ